MSAPRAREDWESDAAHEACRQWLAGWRQFHPGTARPLWQFAQHLGRCAVGFQAEGMSRVELARLAHASAQDGTCLCGEPVESEAAA